MILLGAGASIDAGVPGAYKLTEDIFSQLRGTRRQSEAELFGFVHAKLVERDVKLGGDPFGTINVEEVYDALQRLAHRSADPLSEFVSAWDSGVGAKPFDRKAFQDALQNAINSAISAAGSGRLAPSDWSMYDKISKPVADAFAGFHPAAAGDHTLEPYLEALAACLTPTDPTPNYLREVVSYAVEDCDIIGTLNYDLLIEKCCQKLGYDFSYGLDVWNARKTIRFERSDLRLAKLHGSLNWIENGDDVDIDREPVLFKKRGIIFGGQSSKLVPHGPYLQLRSNFDKRLRESTRFGIIGYSFQDIHMNALIRQWMATKRKAKLVVLNPSLPSDALNKIGRWFDTENGGVSRYRVEVVHISKGAKFGIQDFISELSGEPNPPPPNSQNFGVRTLQ